jgi:hypothetical protein
MLWPNACSRSASLSRSCCGSSSSLSGCCAWGSMWFPRLNAASHGARNQAPCSRCLSLANASAGLRFRALLGRARLSRCTAGCVATLLNPRRSVCAVSLRLVLLLDIVVAKHGHAQRTLRLVALGGRIGARRITQRVDGLFIWLHLSTPLLGQKPQRRGLSACDCREFAIQLLPASWPCGASSWHSAWLTRCRR